MVTISKANIEKRASWEVIHQAHPDGRKLADNHYSRKTKGATHFVGPGEKLVLVTQDKKALFCLEEKHNILIKNSLFKN